MKHSDDFLPIELETGGFVGGCALLLLSRGINIIIAVAVHSEAGLKFKEEIGEIGLNASSLIPIIRQLINR